MRFVSEAGRLKAVLRQTRLTEPARQENSAEHSWHLALMALVLADHAPPGTDLGKVSAMVVLHDLVEIDAGDLYVYADEASTPARRWPSAPPPTGSSGCSPPGRAPRCARSGMSSSSGSPRKPGSRAPLTAFSR